MDKVIYIVISTVVSPTKEVFFHQKLQLLIFQVPTKRCSLHLSRAPNPEFSFEKQ